jgi:hypothetical protein
LLLKEYDKSVVLAAGLRKIKEVLDIVGKTEVEREAEFRKMKTLQNRIRGRINVRTSLPLPLSLSLSLKHIASFSHLFDSVFSCVNRIVC